MTPDEEIALRSKDPAAHALFARVRALIARRGEWDGLVGISLEPVARFCSTYLRAAREIAALSDVQPADLRELQAGLEEQRRAARAALVEFAVLDEEFTNCVPPLDEQGEDPTIAALCAPLSLDSGSRP